jgi:two-component SAPR family response regulator
MSGVEFLEQASEIFSEAKRLLLTAYDEEYNSLPTRVHLP